MRRNGEKVELHRVSSVFFKSTEIFLVVLVWVPEDASNDDWGWQGEIDNASVRGDVPLYFLLLTKYVVGRNFEETDEAGEITRLDGYHEEVLLLLKFIF